MAHVSSLISVSSRPPRFTDFSSSSFKLGVEKCRNQHVVCCRTEDHNQCSMLISQNSELSLSLSHTLYLSSVCVLCSNCTIIDWSDLFFNCCTSNSSIEERCGTQRREMLLQTAFTVFSLPVLVSHALAETDVPEDFRIFSDDVNKYKISIPKGWQVGAGEPNGFKSITAFYPEEASSSNVSVVITGLGADFTKMESFGKVEAFAENLVSGLDRSWQRPPGVTAKLIDSKSSKGFYYIEYSLQNPGESCRHIYTAIGMASNGWYNRLYTVTGQFLDEDSEKYSSKIQKTIASFKFI